LNLTILPTPFTVDSVSACESYTWPVNGVTYTQDISIIGALVAANGCDSTINLVLDILGGLSTAQTVTACNSYYWTSGNQFLTASGSYIENFTDQNGCDSSAILHLTINQIDTTITPLAIDQLSANASEVDYQWLDCENGFAILDGDTNQIFNVNQFGSYAVQVSSDDCIDTSACYNFFLDV